MLKLKRAKTGDRKYDLVDRKTGIVIGEAAQTGEHGRDNYPWEWGIKDDRLFGNLSIRTTGSFDSLRGIVDWIESAANQTGIIKLTDEYVSGYDIKDGQYFRYGAYTYQALCNANGEFNAYIQVLNYKNQSSDMRIAHSDLVRLYRVEFAPAK